MNRVLLVLLLLINITVYAQNQEINSDTITVFKKRVLDRTEIDFLGSYYTQEGTHSAVGGGVGTESLLDYTPTVIVSIPLNDDDVLTIDAGISAYTSASSSNTNPFDASGASTKGGEEEDNKANGNSNPVGSPWIESTGASRSDVLTSLSATYSHSSDNRNNIWGVTGAFSVEYDYYSIGFGGNYARLFNEKNTELSVRAKVYLDQWSTIYPTELEEFAAHGSNFLNQGYFQGVNVYDQNGNISPTGYNPIAFSEATNKSRNSYSVSLGLSQILSKRAQVSIFADVIAQSGLLSTPYHRIYFSDRPNFYIGDDPARIANYTSSSNVGVYQLADDTEQLPGRRLKIPVGMRFNYYLNEIISLRSYYRFYSDDWGITGHTASLELPIKVSARFTLYPTYRFYNQTASDYFAPYEQHVSTSTYYTSDYDLSQFSSQQYGIGVKYNDIFTKFKILKYGLKTINLRYNHYSRSDGLKANIISTGFKFVLD